MQTVVVHVFPVKDQLPLEVSGRVRSLTVKETEVVYITQTHLHFSDRENPDADLTYVITQLCFSPLHPGQVQVGVHVSADPEQNLRLIYSFHFRLMDAGRLFYTDSTNAMKKDHMVPVLKSFTQVCIMQTSGGCSRCLKNELIF